MIARILGTVCAVALAGGMAMAAGTEKAPAGQRPLALHARVRTPDAAGAFEVREKTLDWKPSETAVIICDMWDRHWCRGATSRVGELAPHIDQFIRKARSMGMLIVHSPSSCMAFYEGQPARKRAQSAPPASNLPKGIGSWCSVIPEEEKGVYPIDQADGGCDDQPTCAMGSPWTRQIDTIGIRDEDAISDSGPEIWNLCEQRGIRNVMLMGVHLNMCVLGRPFGLRNMVRYGKNAVLVRDLTDTMYNSRSRPYVNHFRGTALMVEHVEKYVCPTISSDQLLGGKPFHFHEDR
jgi:nicotinamidase-related amidase